MLSYYGCSRRLQPRLAVPPSISLAQAAACCIVVLSSGGVPSGCASSIDWRARIVIRITITRDYP